MLGELKAEAERRRRAQRAVERRLTQAGRRAREAREERAARAAGPITRAALRSGGEEAKKWVAPVESYTLSAGYASAGKRWAHSHTGQDFAVGTGTPVRAVGAGTVVRTGSGGPFGNHIVIKHPNGYYTQYAHLSRIQTRQGDRVHAGEQIGLSGSTGNSTGPHLHFEVRVTPDVGSGVDPLPWLRSRGVHV